MAAIFIFGKGYLGAPLTEHLRAAGHCVGATRRVAEDDATFAFDINAFMPPVPVPQAWQQDAVWVCLLPPAASENYAKKLQQIIASAEVYAVRRFVFAGSTSVYGNAPRLCDEHTPCAPQSVAARKIYAVENYLLASRIPSVAILRLGGLYDDSRHPVQRLSGRKNLQGARHLVNVVSRAQAVAALTAAALHPDNIRIRNVVAPSHPSRQDFYTAEAQRLGLPVPQFDPSDVSDGKTVISRYL